MRNKIPAPLISDISFLVRFFSALLALTFVGMLCGCAYHLGPSNDLEPAGKSARVNPVINQTMEPRLGDAVTTALRKQLQRDGTYRLAPRGSADIVVSGTIPRFVRHELSLLPKDV